ncbi:MAG: MoaD/ThiS family protein [Deltaproteobacteria bacterium]|nr:MoaD/ThiS family protein [Deltaproteobacteria bacterium]
MKVHIPTPLRSYTNDASEVEASGATVGELLLDLDRQFPGLRYRMVDEQQRIRPHMKVFVNGEQTFDLAHPIKATDYIHILQALSGG